MRHQRSMIESMSLQSKLDGVDNATSIESGSDQTLASVDVLNILEGDVAWDGPFSVIRFKRLVQLRAAVLAVLHTTNQ